MDPIYRILYVDDEPALLTLSKTYLERSQEFTVDIAKSAKEALGGEALSSYDAIISDYQMPEIDGIEFLKEVRSRFGDIPFILFTGKGREEVVIDAINNGADFYLQKGIDTKAQFAELAHYVRKAIGRKWAEMALKESENRFRRISSLISDFAYSCRQDSDSNYRIDWMTGSADHITGYSEAEIRAMKCWGNLVIPEDSHLFALNVSGLSPGTSGSTELRIRRKDGEIVWVDSFAECIADIENTESSILFGACRDITERKRYEEALRESEEKLRLKLDAILSAEYDIGEVEFSNIIDSREIQSLMDDFYSLTQMGVAILDLKGNILVSTGWQDICTKFHRVNEESCRNCTESDLYLTGNVKPGKYLIYKCKNNMWDMVTPITIGQKHMGNLFLGQFFFDDEVPDRSVFEAQAEKYGFDKEKYLAALDRVPRWSRNKVDTIMDFYTKFASMVSRLSYSNLQLAKALLDLQRAVDALARAEEKSR